MSNIERIFHSILFEVFALIIGVTLAAFFIDHDKTVLTGLGIVFSIIAMVWNYFYNKVFDYYFTQERITRGLKVRVMHALLFEFGLMVATTPIIMWALNLDLLSALLIDVSAAVFFTAYALFFNWCYDHLRHQYQLALEARL
jgi:uncharacterized membrane protein